MEGPGESDVIQNIHYENCIIKRVRFKQFN